jgi:dihydropteroate synthase
MTDNFLAKKIPKIVGILNLTPDSFSDGGKYYNEKSAITQTTKMLDEGADIIDIGAESTRPNATILSADQEISRLQNILPKLVEIVKNFNQQKQKNVEISIDSYHYETMVFASQNHIKFINDISGLIDERVINFIAKNNLTAILMHNLAIHANPDIIINRELNVFSEITEWANQKIAILQSKNIDKSQLIFDPGIGFSKNGLQSLRIIKNISAYKSLGLKIYVGHSNKSFLDYLKINPKNELTRHQKTLIVSQYLAKNSVDYIRVHDVGANISAIKEYFNKIQ